MRKGQLFFFLFLFLPMVAAGEEDSTAYFQQLLQYTQPSATDVGGFSTPEILAVSRTPFVPRGGDRVRVFAKVISFHSMVPYSIVSVSLHYSVGGVMQEVPMKATGEDDVYQVTLPPFKAGTEVLYGVSAKDSWGNVARELLPGEEALLVTDPVDPNLISPSLDIRALKGAYGEGKLTLCLELGAALRRSRRKEALIYGISVGGEDARYRPYLTAGGEVTSGFIAAYIPFLRLSDLFPAGELTQIFTQVGRKETRAHFEKQEKSFCFSFPPQSVRSDFSLGLKVAGVTISASISELAIKPQDGTKMALVLPRFHSFWVEE